MRDDAFRKAFDILWRRFRVENWAEGKDPFEVLVSIVVSQNSTDLVTERVVRDLSHQLAVRPKEVATAPESLLIDALRPAGLARQKVPRIQELAREVLRRFGGDLMRVLDEPDPRQTLMDLPGIGPKTADVWLSLVAGADTMPVDTHIARLARRWRLTRRKDYAAITAKLQSLIPPRRRARGHLVLIQFGREICQARRPRCEECPVYGLCDATVKRPRATSASR
ncbi:MAG: endonuclease III [Methanobacteriota archaeon]|nr:MAG: endonuclease III [Euryarchaeota archaeon]